MAPEMRSARPWLISLGLAGINDCGMALYHFFLPTHMGWAKWLHEVPSSIVWALYALNFSWSLLLLLMGSLVLQVARLGPIAGSFARRTVFTVGLFWIIHGAYTWVNPLPMPAALAWLKVLLGAFPALMVALHWWPLYAYRKSA